ncbi:hypothetical protein HXP44_26835 [Streptomyces sioyaensis]|uniref:Secreted protein n=1 Tax=Streptomyces sioyaensis TaxID=67364 RepID=A0A4Q1QQC6_9ACTN|nr:DUF5719 family protein [Streptomyces sioyaensis]MBM4795581.1 hypothetical protein [Streptomyces sioyaensis]RXS64175.1 hypothetical protein EST54_23115 [Streptomyces sioyaensis]
MKRTMMSLIGVAAALGAVTGVAAVTAPGGGAQEAPRSSSRLPVQRSALLCPAPTSSEVGQTDYTAFAPKGAAAGADGKKGTAALLPAGTVKDAGGGTDNGKGKKSSGKNGKDGKGAGGGADSAAGQAVAPRDTKPVVPLQEAGKPVTTSTDSPDAPALVGAADGALAPGWTVQQTTSVAAGSGRGLMGLSCTTPDTTFWFPGVSTATDRQDYVHLTNPDPTPAVVDLQLRGKDGSLGGSAGEDITVPPHATVPVLLSTLTSAPTTNASLQVVARGGRIGAAVQATDGKLGSDWLPAAADPSPSVVLPGIPKDATSVRLVALAPGESDADLKVQLATPTGLITPAGLESLHLKSGMTTAVDLKDVTKGEAGSLVLTPSDGGSKVPVAAALRVTRGKGAKQEMAFIPATRPVEQRATAADNRDKGSTLSLVAPEKGKDAKVKVTASAGSGGGTPVTKTYTVKGGTSLDVAPPTPQGLKGTYALTVEPAAGSGPVYAARMLSRPQGGVPAFTVQTLPDDRGTVLVPTAGQDLSVLTK